MVLFPWHINLTTWAFQRFFIFTPRLGEMVANLTYAYFFRKWVASTTNIVVMGTWPAFCWHQLRVDSFSSTVSAEIRPSEKRRGNLPCLDGSETDLRNGRVEEMNRFGWCRWVGGGFCWQMKFLQIKLKWKIGVFLVKVLFRWDNDLNNQKDSWSMCFFCHLGWVVFYSSQKIFCQWNASSAKKKIMHFFHLKYLCIKGFIVILI